MKFNRNNKKQMKEYTNKSLMQQLEYRLVSEQQ